MIYDELKLFWTKSAQLDLIEIVDFIRKDSEISAQKLYHKIKNKVSGLIKLPSSGRIVPEFREINIIQYRELVVSNWRVIYTIRADKIFILCVFDARRNSEELLSNKIRQASEYHLSRK